MTFNQPRLSMTAVSLGPTVLASSRAAAAGLNPR
jgi:hypothetical protein